MTKVLYGHQKQEKNVNGADCLWWGAAAATTGSEGLQERSRCKINPECEQRVHVKQINYTRRAYVFPIFTATRSFDQEHQG